MSEQGLGSTYRIQVQALGFERTRLLVPYLAELGIETLYLSPVLAAAPGSSHGYDVIDPDRLDPSLGTRAELETLFDELETHGMRALLDIVPNHMAAVPENSRWWDVLRCGIGSVHASTFDIDWGAHQGRVLVPVLARPLVKVLEAGAVSMKRGDVLELDGIPFPLAAQTATGDDLGTILERQHYRAAYWRASATEGNYRRFFDINSLIGVRVEDPDVFQATHAFLTGLSGHRAVGGVRVDHVDGLSDPAHYLDRLKERLPSGRAIVVEKILGQNESLDQNWPVDGTSGYEFADRLTALFVDQEGSTRLRRDGEAICGVGATFAALTLGGKREALQDSFCSELDQLARSSKATLDAESPGHDLSGHDLRLAWIELTVGLPVYRTYIGPEGASESDQAHLTTASLGPAHRPETRRALAILRHALSERARAGSPWLSIARRWQQLSGAAMAKGAEDTATYRYPGLLARADVGGDPDAPGDGLERFHSFAAGRTGGLNATSTHDSKRNEDARCRLAVLSEADAEWSDLVRRWHVAFGTGSFAPHPTEELALFQSFLALWPPADSSLDQGTLDRIVRHAIKAAREAKVRTSWTEPDERYEEALTKFVLSVHRDTAFRRDMTAFSHGIGPAALVNSLSTVVLKLCAPGVPDFYQGTELVEATLTDPDNRRPVDFAARAEILTALPEPSGTAAASLLARWVDGHIKMYVMRTLLRDRREHAQLYEHGRYEPLSATTRHIAAFRRHLDGHGSVVAVVPRLVYRLARGGFPQGVQIWQEETLSIPRVGSGQYQDILTGRTIEAAGDVRLSQLLDLLPVAVLQEAP